VERVDSARRNCDGGDACRVLPSPFHYNPSWVGRYAEIRAEEAVGYKMSRPHSWEWDVQFIATPVTKKGRSRRRWLKRIMVRLGIVVPEYEQILNEPTGNGSMPMRTSGDAANLGDAGALAGGEQETEALVKTTENFSCLW
jgi:hypothetical protein